MAIRKTIWKIVLVLLGIVMVISLVMNYVHYKRKQREEQYVRLLYNQFIFDVSMASNYLGAVNGHVDYNRAAVDTADAANVLYSIEKYELIVENSYSGTLSPPHIRDIANFLSYVSLAFVSENTRYLINNGTSKKTVVTVSQKSGKNIMLKLNTILKTNMKDSNIPPDKVDTVFNQMNGLIPSNIRTQTSVLTFFNH